MYKILFALLLLLLNLQAHRLNIVVYDEEETIIIKSYFSKKSMCKNCDAIIDNGGTTFRTKTSDKGLIEIKKSSLKSLDLNIKISGGDGHFEEMNYTLPNDVKISKPIFSKKEISFYEILAAVGYIFAIFALIFVFYVFLSRFRMRK